MNDLHFKLEFLYQKSTCESLFNTGFFHFWLVSEECQG